MNIKPKRSHFQYFIVKSYLIRPFIVKDKVIRDDLFDLDIYIYNFDVRKVRNKVKIN